MKPCLGIESMFQAPFVSVSDHSFVYFHSDRRARRNAAIYPLQTLAKKK